MPHKKIWMYGDKTKIAHAAGISPQFFCDLYRNRSRCSPDLALRLEIACARHGYHIPKSVWVFPDERFGNPLFPVMPYRRGC